MAVVGSPALLVDYGELAVPLPRYAQLVGEDELLFFGVQNADALEGDCDVIWLKRDRDIIGRYLAEAQFEIEQVTGYPLSPRWITDEEHEYSPILIANWARVIEPGVRAESDIALDEAINMAGDPGIVGPVATTVTEESEIRVFHPDSDIEIHPSQIYIAGGFVTIDIPRARLVNEANADNPATGLEYDDLGNFEPSVDVKRVYTSIATEGTLKWPHACSSGACCTCGEHTQDACMTVVDKHNGIIDILPGTYSGGSWGAAASCCSGKPTMAEINYKAGITTTKQAEDAIIRLAHSKMPHSPCGCEFARNMWIRDRNVPPMVTRERINCPFGMSDGAWIAWRFANAMRDMRMMVFG